MNTKSDIIGWNKFWYAALLLTWMTVNFSFWSWWLAPEHQGSPWLYWLVSLAFFYDGTLLPTLFFYYLGKMKSPNKDYYKTFPKGKVAVITLTVPTHENQKIVEQQLIAMTKIDYPHDSYILVDGTHSPEIEKLAKKYDVYYFSRYDEKKWGSNQVALWNQEIPPFKTKTKAGNVNAWIDAYGDKYDYFTQLDIDHKPQTHYLDEVMRYFSDPKIAWVQAPSVYGNLDTWTARGAAEQELVLQGPLQKGFYGSSDVPFIIGSHSTYRMRAIKEIGGFQPTRAEDHLDTVYLAAKGYKGVFVPEVIAVGDGPENFETYLAQQFAWAYSLIQVFFYHTPKVIWKMNPKVAFQMFFVQTWYPVWSLSMLFLFLSPILALLSDSQISEVSLSEFLLRSGLVTATAFLGWSWSRNWQQPKGVPLTWRGVILHIARWVIVVNALIQAVLRVKKPYMITSKGKNNGIINTRAILPYLLLALLTLFISLWYIYKEKGGPTQSYLLFTLENAFFMMLVAFMPFIIYLRENGYKAVANIKKGLAMLTTSVFLFFGVGVSSLPLIAESVQPVQNPVVALANVNFKRVKADPQPVEVIEQPQTFEIEAKFGDSVWSLADKAVDQYLEQNPQNLTELQKNHLVYMLSLDYPRTIKPGDTLTYSEYRISQLLDN